MLYNRVQWIKLTTVLHVAKLLTACLKLNVIIGQVKHVHRTLRRLRDLKPLNELFLC